jgi:hypothetical protein
LPLRRADTGEFFTFEAAAPTHLPATASLLKHFRRQEQRLPDQYPVIRFRLDGWDRGPPVGWVHKPAFVVVGHTAKDDAAKQASRKDDLDDEIPY